MNRRLPLSALLGLLALPALSPAALNLEGMTGYWMVPSAWVQPEGMMALSLNSHFNDTVVRKSKTHEATFNHRNLMLSVTPIPYAEFVGRFAFKDLSWNCKTGISLGDTTWHRTGMALGIQDFWGGQRFFHSAFAVGTQRLGPIEGSIGWGGGQERGVYYRTPSRLDGWFWGFQVDVLPESLPVQLELMHDEDGAQSHSGIRAQGNLGDLSVVMDGAWAWEYKRWEGSTQLVYRLPEARAYQKKDQGNGVRLRVGPWAQSFLGTEVGDFDAQVALEEVALLVPTPDVWVGGRLRTLLWYSENFDRGKAFEANRQKPTIWLEGAAIGYRKEQLGGGPGLWSQAGVIDGSWFGGATELRSSPLLPGVRLGALAGAWHSWWWHDERWMGLPWVEWVSPDRAWQANLDAGRFWNQDNGIRFRLGRRYGRMLMEAGVSRSGGDVMGTGRLTVELDGLSWKPTSWFTLEPTQTWSHGLATRVSSGHNDPNWIRVGKAADPPLMVRGRDESWP